MSGFRKGSTDDAREGRLLQGVEVRVDRLKVDRVAGAKAVREFRQGEAVTEEGVFDVGVVERGEEIEDFIYLLNALRDDVAGEGNIPNWCPK